MDSRLLGGGGTVVDAHVPRPVVVAVVSSGENVRVPAEEASRALVADLVVDELSVRADRVAQPVTLVRCADFRHLAPEPMREVLVGGALPRSDAPVVDGEGFIGG